LENEGHESKIFAVKIKDHHTAGLFQTKKIDALTVKKNHRKEHKGHAKIRITPTVLPIKLQVPQTVKTHLNPHKLNLNRLIKKTDNVELFLAPKHPTLTYICSKRLKPHPNLHISKGTAPVSDQLLLQNSVTVKCQVFQGQTVFLIAKRGKVPGTFFDDEVTVLLFTYAETAEVYNGRNAVNTCGRASV
jgi:hypothetical protein